MLVLFITNCSEAFLAAVGMRWLSDAPVRFDTLRRVVVFIVVVVLLKRRYPRSRMQRQ